MRLDTTCPIWRAIPKNGAAAEHFRVPPTDSVLPQDGWRTLDIYGPQAREFLHFALTSDVLSLEPGEYQPTWALWPDGTPITYGVVHRLHAGTYHLHVPRQAARLAMWLQALSDGFVIFDPTDIYGLMPVPVSVGLSSDVPDLSAYALDFDEDWADDDTAYSRKAYCRRYGPNSPPPRSRCRPLA